MINGAEQGAICNWAIQLAIRNAANDCAVNVDILLANLEIAMDFKEKADKNIVDRFNKQPTPTIPPKKVEYKIQKIGM